MKPQKKTHTTKQKVSYSEEYGFLGHLLYSERLLRNISVETVAVELNLSTYIINDLETGHLDSPPGFSYMVGFIRTYASYLGLNSADIARYIRPPANAVLEEETALRTPFQPNQLPSKYALWGSLCVLIFMVLGYSTLKLQLPADSPLYLVKLDSDLKPAFCPFFQSATQLEKLSVSFKRFLDIYHVPFVSTPEPGNKEAVLSSTVCICCDQDAWIAIKDIHGNIIEERLLHKGDRIKLPLDFEGTLATGNAGGIYFECQGTSLPAIGAPGQVIYNLPLSVKKILQNVLKPANN